MLNFEPRHLNELCSTLNHVYFSLRTNYAQLWTTPFKRIMFNFEPRLFSFRTNYVQLWTTLILFNCERNMFNFERTVILFSLRTNYAQPWTTFFIVQLWTQHVQLWTQDHICLTLNVTRQAWTHPQKGKQLRAVVLAARGHSSSATRGSSADLVPTASITCKKSHTVSL